MGSASSVWSTPAPIEPASPSNTFTARSVRSKTGPGKSFQHLLSGLMRKVGTTRSLELCSNLYKKGSAPCPLHFRRENTTYSYEGWKCRENEEFSLPSSLPFLLAFLSLPTFPPSFFSFPFPSFPSYLFSSWSSRDGMILAKQKLNHCLHVGCYLVCHVASLWGCLS